MRRQDAELIAATIAKTIFALENDHPEQAHGARLVAVQLASIVENDGRMDSRSFLRRAGILSRGRLGRNGYTTHAARAVLEPVEPLDGPPGQISQ